MMEAVKDAVTPALGLCGVVLAFSLNAAWQSWRSASARREDDVKFRTEVRGHMAVVEKRLDRIEHRLHGPDERHSHAPSN